MDVIRKLKKSERGQAVIEFVLVLPILLMLILGVLEFGWLYSAKIVATSAVREGARTRAVLGFTADPVKAAQFDLQGAQAAKNAAARTLSPEDIVVTFVPVVDIAQGVYDIRAEMVCTVEPLVGLFLREDQIITAVATFRME
ncbi:pilus assembly protein [Proteiniclasticum sp. BAD-10]|uniref:Pilus assembly protein n=1 Tax=Proteiniclasticum sediminis TaxID=2804028 RepID=A0A941CM85_9CLOT|nr:TadE family protein [Proteiniclasticum sediminis]MBR0575255.1 pilus assembly protein [Proteiniclasticum sediminis]